MLFEDLKLMEPIKKAIKTKGYTKPTAIQSKAIPPLLMGKDLLGCAQTGTGKTAAFAIPILQGIALQQKASPGRRQIQALVVAPTRELAIQISDSFKEYGKYLNLKTLVIYGGVSQHPQTKDLTKGIDILVATPGRLLDLITQRYVSLKSVKYFVLDEADMMLDMGMLLDVRKIITHLPQEKQTMFFSATMPAEIEKLANSILKDPAKVVVTPVSSTVEIINQELYYVDRGNKAKLLTHLLKNKAIISALVFSRTKHGANKIVKYLEKAGFNAEAIHGNKSQTARQLALKNFKERKTRILVATDIAARGIDIEELSHVINFDLPEVPETYVHRIGRTGRASHGGIAISFCSHDEKSMLKGIQRLISKSIEEVSDHPYPLVDTNVEPVAKPIRRNTSTKPGTQDQTRNRRRNNEMKKKAGRTEKSRSSSKGYKSRSEE
ncbi:DEAD/DEAH box helicase [Alkalibacter rhizosphaerae]|uniref:DEAD/DEAH box helicase n=1 Tax=Alkalibacter rhizosphaerae TaxID=2815577 RepID=A0A974XGP2_9FIRM|nr:DEAD/DEAH box helicase [Alkalibacter rhizosphaerae]QSX09478.1 DEAD/DEAH box helicase [Alkalibacter rhizosphaerae]